MVINEIIYAGINLRFTLTASEYSSPEGGEFYECERCGWQVCMPVYVTEDRKAAVLEDMKFHFQYCSGDRGEEE